MEEKQTAFQIALEDNVATALTPLKPGPVTLLGDAVVPVVQASAEVPLGHKIALRDIRAGEDILKYGVVIGRATADVPAGSWVHLHVMGSVYDQRSSHLDVNTGAPKDTQYE
ncbi:MAG: UxaA family hydrolase [Lawsonibacter sp.]|nr:UxaA family hydrolase [Lawsonibacter sp.]